MTEAPRLVHVDHLVCPGCGEVLEDEDREIVMSENRSLKRKARSLERRIAELEGAGVKQTEVDEAFDAWLAARPERPGKKPILGDKRARLLRWALKHYGREDTLKVVRASSTYPFLVFGSYSAAGKERDRKDDLLDFLANEKRFEQLRNLADHGNPEAQQKVEATRLSLVKGGGPLLFSDPLDRYLAIIYREWGQHARRAIWIAPEERLAAAWWECVCPLHPHVSQTETNPLKLREYGGKVVAECAHGCLRSHVLAALDDLERKQIERALANQTQEVA